MDTLYAYKTVFTLSSQSSLDDFWSYLIFRLNLENSEFTYDRFARLYNTLCSFEEVLSLGNPIYITLEESKTKYLISIQTRLGEFIEEMHSKLNSHSFLHEYTSDTLSYFIAKKKNTLSDNTAKNVTNKKSYFYSFIESSDLEEMLNILEKMQDKNYEKIFDSLDITEITDYRSTFSYYSSYLQYYPELTVVNNIVAELSVLLSLYTKECKILGNDFRVLLKSFLNNLMYWQKKIFIESSEHLNFMDESLKADLSQIKIALHLYDDQVPLESEENLDNIFDF